MNFYFMMTNLPMNKNMKTRWLYAFLLLSGLWLVGCSTDKGGETAGDAGSRSLVFTVSTEAAAEEDTRGYLLNELDGEFGLFCAKYDYDEEWGEDGQALNFMYNEMVMGNGNYWTTSEGYFVPKTEKMKFFAYYPYYDDVQMGTCPLTMYGGRSTVRPAPSFTYIMPDDAEYQQDLMYAMSDELQADPVTHQLGVVHLHFRHLLTGISFSAKSNETCTLKRITLTNLYKKGDFEFKNGAELRADATYDSGEGFGEVYVDLDMKLKSTYKTADAGKSFMLILQPKDEEGNIIVNQEAKMIITLEAGGKTFNFSKSIVDLAESLGNSKNTLLRLSVESLQRIKVSASIVNWGHGATFDGAVSDQPTLELEPLILDWDDKDADNNDLVTDVITGPQDTNP
jgi:hypothetical protein